MQYVDGHLGLVVGCSREGLALLAGDGRVGFNQLGHYTTEGFDTQRQRGYVEQHDVLTSLLIEDGTLNGSTYGHNFVGVHAL